MADALPGPAAPPPQDETAAPAATAEPAGTGARPDPGAAPQPEPAAWQDARRAAVWRLARSAARVLRRAARIALVRAARIAVLVRLAAARTPGWMWHRWRGSLQVRVVTTTLVVSAVTVTVLGLSLLQQITDGLTVNRETSAKNQAYEGLSIAENQSGVSGQLSKNTEDVMRQIVSKLKASGGSVAGSFGVAVMLRPAKDGYPVYSRGWQDQLPRVPPALLKKVSSGYCSPAGNICLEQASLPFPSANSRPEAGLAYGATFGLDNFQLYYFFPLTQELTTIRLLERTLLLVGLALVALLAAIAALVTRWVVVPVARAAQSARLLSTGNLSERLEVRGTDELAALGTSFNEMARSLQEKMAELEELSAVQRQFVSDVSHELRTPLATIRMAGDLLYEARDQLDSPEARAAELLHGQLGRFESLLSDLLEISRYDANAATLEPELVDIGDVVRQAADVAQQLAERRGARIEFRLAAEPCMAEVDRVRVERILRNLLVNAVEHGDGKDVVVMASGDRDAVAVAVRDHGIGLSPGEEHLVFDRFWRADPARARSTGGTGTGLGLAIALEDARLHGGWLEAWGEPGRGSVFRLTLPRTAGAELAGSPLALRPDEADAVDAASAFPAAAGPASSDAADAAAAAVQPAAGSGHE